MRRSVWIIFVLFCLISGSAWVVPASGDSLAALERQGLLFGVLGLGALCFAEGRGVFGGGLRLAAAGVGFFGLPMVVVEVVRGSVGEISRSALFAMVPVVVVLVIATGDAAGDAMRMLVPALMGLGGLWLLLPLDFSTSVRGLLMLGLVGATVVVVGVCSVWLYRMLRSVGLASAIAVVCLANSAFLLGCSGVRGELVWRGVASAASLSTLVDAVEVVLIVWLLREMPPVPILESYGLVRPEWTVRMGFGTILLAGGAGMLLLLKDVDNDRVLSLR
jgi:hypothetical protein